MEVKLKRIIFIIFIFLALIQKDIYGLGTQIQHIDFLVTNETDFDYNGVIWIDTDDIYSLIPEFDGISFVVTTTNSPDIATDLQKIQAYELPSQAIDENGDGRQENIGIYISIEAQEKKVITVHIGQPERIVRLKSWYKKLCDASLMNDCSSLLWESDKVGYRYDRLRNVINIIGKMTHRNLVDLIKYSADGRNSFSLLCEEIIIQSNPPGFAGIGILENGRVRSFKEFKPSEIAVRASGPIATCVEIKIYEKDLSINSNYILSQGNRWTKVKTDISGDLNKKQFVVGILKRGNEQIFNENNLISTLAGSPLIGLGVCVFEDYFSGLIENDGYHFALLKPDKKGHIEYAFAGYWELEHQANIVDQGELDILMPKTYYMDRYKTAGWILMRPSRMDNKDEFQIRLKNDLTWIKKNQVNVKCLSEKAMTYSEKLPPESVKENRKKSYDESLELIIGRLRLFAEEGLAEEGKERFWITSDPNGKPSFIRPNRSWGDGYWVSMLWDAFYVTGDTIFKQWALKSNELMLGGEETPGHSTGLNYWNASARSYKETKDNVWLESVIKCADMFLQIAHPVNGFVPGYSLDARKDKDNPLDERAGYYIDAMICVPILWSAYQETKDEKYLEAGIRHTDATINALIEPDGAVYQLAWFHPKTGEILAIGTTQGYAGNTRWSRGHSWVLDGFPDAYKATKKKEYLDVFRHSAGWMMKNLPDDLVPWYDYDDQGVFWRFRDTSAGAICAYGLMRMSDLETDSTLAKEYKNFAIRMVNSLIDNYLAPVNNEDTRPEGMLSHQCYVKVNRGEQIWGSFSLMKALCWLREKGIKRE